MAHKKNSNEWGALFDRFDKDKSGDLSVHELRDLLRAGDCNISDKQIADAFLVFDSEGGCKGGGGDGKITRKEFIKAIEAINQFVEKVKVLFIELDADESGYLDRNEVRELLKRAQVTKFSEQDLTDLINEADSSGDGKISLGELINIFSG